MTVGADGPGEPAIAWSRRDWVVVVVLWSVLAALYVATASFGPAQTNDTRAATVGAWSLGTRGSAVLPPAWPPSANYWGAEGRHDHVLVNRFPGVAYWAAPAYAFTGRGEAPVHPFLVDPVPAAVTAALTAAAVAALMFALLRGEMSRPVALGAAGVLATATSLWSVAADAMWPHAPAMLALTAMLLAWRRSRPLVAATCAVGAVLVRPHLVVVMAVLAVFAWRQGNRRDAVALAAGGVAGVSMLSAYSAWAFGTALPVAGYDAVGHLDGLVSHSAWQTVRDLGLAFVSPSRGLLIASPFLLAAVFALASTWRCLPAWTRIAVGAGMVYLLVQVRAVGYRGGDDFFAYRVSLEVLVLAAPALTLAVVAAARHHRRLVPVLGVLTAISIGIHGYGAVAGGISSEKVRQWEEVHAAVVAAQPWSAAVEGDQPRSAKMGRRSSSLSYSHHR